MRRLMVVSALAALAAWGCGWFAAGEIPADVPATTAPEVVEYGLEEAMAQGPALTRQAEDRRRLREQHAELIARTGVDPLEPTATALPGNRQQTAVQIAGGGGPVVATADHSDWFDIDRGLYFYRERGGDWTAQALRERHPAAPLIYKDDYVGVANFADGSMQRELAGELAFDASERLPLVGAATPGMVDLIQWNLGYELRDAAEPVFNVWGRFRVDDSEGKAAGTFAVGGVAELEIARYDAGGASFEYLQFGRWIGPVVVERLE